MLLLNTGQVEAFFVAELRRCTGAHFDPQVVEVFLKFLDEEQTTREEN